jgi:hypothetical protein
VQIAALEVSMVVGFDQHHGPATETTLVVRRARGDSDLQGEGEKGVVSTSDEFHPGMFFFSGRCVVYRRPRRRLLPFLFEV